MGYVRAAMRQSPRGPALAVGPYYGRAWSLGTMRAGDARGLGQYQPTQDQRDLRTLHSLALSIYQLKQEGDRALRAGDTARVRQVVTSLETMRAHFQQVAQRFVVRDAVTYSAFERFVVGVGDYIVKILAALPSALAALPKALVDTVTDVTGHTGARVWGAVLPWIGLGLLAIWLVKQGEGTRTGRRLVARL